MTANESKDETKAMRRGCRFCGDPIPASRKPKNGAFETAYCSKAHRMAWHTMTSLNKKSKGLRAARGF